MKKTQNILIIILILVLLLGAIVFVMQRDTGEGPIIENGNNTTSTPEEGEEETAGFSETGNIVINNPGFEEDVFYLSYEKPGQVGLSEKLIFNEDSSCVKEQEVNCNETIPENREDWSGKRVKVDGSETEEGIIVEKLEFLDQEEIDSTGERIQKARDWIVNNSPTYKFDGKNLQFVEERGLDLVGCENCYELEFTFTSTHGGYGDRTGEPVIQVITSHNIVVLLEDGKVTKVTTDGKFNEMTGKMVN